MAYTVVKNGDYVVNRTTYEYMCDSMEDLMKIPGNRVTTGSTAIVIKDGGLRLFVADSKDKWVDVTGDELGGGAGGSFELTKDKIISALGYTPAENGCECEEITKEKIIELLGYTPAESAECQCEELTKDKIIELLGYEPAQGVEEITKDKIIELLGYEPVKEVEELTKDKIIEILGYTPKNEADAPITGDGEELTKDKIIEILGYEPIESVEELTKDKVIELLGYTPIESVDLSTIEERLENLENKAPSDAPINGSSTWELINEISIAEAISAIVISEDVNQNPLNLKEIYIEFEITKPTKTSNINIMLNDVMCGQIINGLYSSVALTKSCFKGEANGLLMGYTTNAITGTTNPNTALNSYGMLSKGMANSINSISISSSNGTPFPADSIIRVYGR